MPREGYSTVTIPMQLHHRLHEAARSEYRSMPKQIEHMLNELYPDSGNKKPGKCESSGTNVADPNIHATKFRVDLGAAAP
jgi:hypothetical protein